MLRRLQARLSAAATAAGLSFLMWAFFMLPAFGDGGLRFRLGTAAMGSLFIVCAVKSGKLTSRIEIVALAVSASLGIAMFVIGLIACLVRH